MLNLNEPEKLVFDFVYEKGTCTYKEIQEYMKSKGHIHILFVIYNLTIKHRLLTSSGMFRQSDYKINKEILLQ